LNKPIKRLEEILAGPRVLDWRAFALIQPLFLVFGTITFFKHVQGDFWHIVGALLIGLVAEVLFAFLVRPLFAPASKQNSFWRIFLLYWLIGELDGVMCVTLLNIPFREPGTSVSAWTTLSSNGFLHAVWLTTAHLAISLLKSDVELLQKLSTTGLALNAMQVEANRQLASELGNLRSTISDQISRALVQIKTQVGTLNSSSPKTELTERATLVMQLCDSEVRALSHEISQNNFEPSFTEISIPKILNPWGRGSAKISEIKLHWPWVAGIGLLNAAIIALQHGGWIAAMASLLSILTGLGLLLSLDAARRNRLKVQSAVLVIILVVGEYLISSAVIISVLWLIGFKVPEIRHFVQSVYLIVPIVIVIVWSLVQIIHGFAYRLRLHTDELAASNKLLASELELIQLKSARARERFGKLLHGTTQGRLASVSLALAAAASSSSEKQIELLLQQARGQLAQAEIELAETLNSDAISLANAEGLDAEIASLQDGWRNLVDIQSVVSDPARAVLESRLDLLQAVAEAMQECITNAVRHGHAKSMRFNLALDNEIILEAINDGMPVLDLTPGFGIRSISETASDVQISSQGQTTRVEIRWSLS